MGEREREREREERAAKSRVCVCVGGGGGGGGNEKPYEFLKKLKKLCHLCHGVGLYAVAKHGYVVAYPKGLIRATQRRRLPHCCAPES